MPPLNIPKIKREGLEVDFFKCTKEGYKAIQPEDHYRLKTYGACAQKHEGYFMIRIRIPGGVIRADQMERIANLAERFGHGSVHLTTRGDVELHSVKIDNFLMITDELREVGITTRSACGHTFRNILCCHQNGVCPKQPFDLFPWVEKVHQHVFERAASYNPRMPNRLNVSFSGCSDCSADAYINDIGFIAKTIEEGETTLYGFVLWAAGSLGKTPRIGHKLKEFVTFEEVIPALEAIAELHCRYGDHQTVVKGRLKFLVAQWGPAKFRNEFEKLFEEFKEKQPPLPPELAHPEAQKGDRSNNSCIDLSPFCCELPPLSEGVHPQRQSGFYRVQFWVPLGEMSAAQMKQVAELSRTFADERAYHTTRQNFEFHWVKQENVQPLIDAMEQVGFSPNHSESILNVVACPGTSFCSLAVTSAQGAAQVLMKRFSAIHLGEDPDVKNLKINISGCPNSCAKHQVADIGFSGGMTELDGIKRFGYQLYVGGRFNGSAEDGVQIKKGLSDDMVLPCAESLIAIFKEKKAVGEQFPDFVDRLGVEQLVDLLDQKLMVKRPKPLEPPIVMQPRASRGLSQEGKMTRIGTLSEWGSVHSKIVSAFGDEVAVFKTDLGFRACQNLCPHAGGLLGEGESDGKTVTCPLHGWQFDLASGACLTEPGNDIKVYQVDVDEKGVILKA